MLKRVDPTKLKEFYLKHNLRWEQGVVNKADSCCVLGILLLEENLPRTAGSALSLVALDKKGWDYDYLMGLWKGFDGWTQYRPDESEARNLGYDDGIACRRALND